MSYRIRNIGQGPIVASDLDLVLQAGEGCVVAQVSTGLRRLRTAGLVSIEQMAAIPLPVPAAPKPETAPAPVVEEAPEPEAPETPAEQPEPTPEPEPETEPEQSEATAETQPTEDVDTSKMSMGDAMKFIEAATDAKALKGATSRDRRNTVRNAVRLKLQALNAKTNL